VKAKIGQLAMSIEVRRTFCPFWERTLFELWSDGNPVIAANNYLRHDLTLSERTLENKAYHLVAFFRFLQRNSLSFFELDSNTLRPFVLHFRNDLLYRVRAQPDSDDVRKGFQDRQSVTPIDYVHARNILMETSRLFEWWRCIHVGLQSHVPRARSTSTRFFTPSMEDCFSIRVPRNRRRLGENHVLEVEEVNAVWHFLTSESRPIEPRLLLKHPTGPKRGWTSFKALAWKRAQKEYRKHLAWFHRQQVLWALFISSALRRSELPLLMLSDVQFRGNDLWVSVRLRRITEHLGRAKSGPRMVFIGWDHRVITAWQNWVRSRHLLVTEWMTTTGEADHGMFLTNRGGGPLTVRGIECLMVSLNNRFKHFGGEFVEDQFKLHPHAIRHTVEALFEEWGVPREVRQRHLGHRHPKTTDLYGKAYRRTYVNSLSGLSMGQSGGAIVV
jgi:integrase